jgi:hopanoid biosynthesis associated RND transporter like protein HpnN
MPRLTARPLARVVQAACERPLVTLLVSLALAAAALVFTVGHFNMTSDTTKLISAKVGWRQREIAFSNAFPQSGDTTVIVVDGATPELAEAAAAALTARLEPDRKLFLSVRRPDGGPFFEREGLLFLSAPEVEATTEQLVSAQPFLGTMAADPSLRGVMNAISSLAQGVSQGDTSLAAVDKPIASLGAALETVAAGKTTYFSWERMIAGDGKGLKSPTRRFIVVRPRLDYNDLMPGQASSERIRETARALALDPQHGVTVRLTGTVPLSDEEFASLLDRAWLVTGSMLLAMLVMLWLATKSAKLVATILTTTLIGLLLTTAVGLAAVRQFNLISVAFIPLFVGLGVDFGIQLSVRFRAERLTYDDLRGALVAAASGIGGSLALAAAAIVLGFLAFLPTAYIGVSELGIIAGLGMIMGFILNITLLPALIVLLRPRRQTEPVGSARMAPVDRFLVERRKLVLWAFGLSTLASVALLPLVQFDFNPLHLKNPHKESMETLTDIMRDPQQSPYTIDVLRPSLAAADQLATRLSKLPEVAQTVTLSSFVPSDQPRKLAAISDADLLLDPTLNPFVMMPAPTDAEDVAALRDTAAKLRTAAGAAPGAPAAHARQLAAALEKLAVAPPARRAAATQVLIPPLRIMLDQIRAMLQAQPITLQSLPPEIVSDWIAKDGRARVQVSPRGNSNDNATLERFSAAVLKIAPDASGAPISIQQAGRTISWAFIEAGLLSLVAISALLLLVLRSGRQVADTLAPIVLAGFLTLGTCVLIDQPINFANVIAFPLLFGVGVAFHIYFVMAWRAGATNLLQSSLARGVFFSALTTGTAFGSLIFSSHPGTASMGKILMISLIWTLVAALIFEPALLGPPRTDKQRPAT